MTSNGPDAPPLRRRTLVRRLVLGVNLTLAGFLALFVTLDVGFARRNLLREKVIDLQEDATSLLVSAMPLRQRGLPAMQRFLNNIQQAMEPFRALGHPHEIIIQMGAQTLLTPSSEGAPPGTLEALRAAAAAPDHRGVVAGRPVMVGDAAQDDVAVYVLEPFSQIHRTILLLILRRAAANTLIGLAIATLLNLMLRLWLVRPLRAMVDTVQQFGRGELAARMPPVRSVELGVLADEFNSMAAVIEQSEAERRSQMARARAIQDFLRPDLRKISGARFACKYAPAAEIGGDYYDALPSADGGLLLCISDVCGHGVPAAMGASMLKTLLLNSIERESDPAKLLGLLNAAFSRVSPPSDFATLALLHFRPGAPAAAYASAGHEPVFLLRASGQVEDLKATGYPLGVEAGAEWEKIAFDVGPGDRVLMLTDGLVETAAPTGEIYGRDRLLRDAADLRAMPLEEMLAAVFERVAAFRGRAPQSDDLTMLAVEFI